MFNVTHIIQSGGLLLIGAIIYAEVGLFLGFFLPGDTLLIAAGIYAHQGHLSIISVVLVCVLAAIAGDSTAYFLGKKLGPKVFSKPDGVIFRKDHIDQAHRFFKKYGAKTLLISHFLPIIRSFTPLLAGVAAMPYRSFLIYNVIGDVVWGVSIPLLGYYVGSRIPNIDHYILLVVGAAVVATLAPTLYHIIKLQVKRRRATTQR